MEQKVFFRVRPKSYLFVPDFIQEWKTWGGSKISSFISGINLGNEEVG